MVDCDDVTGQWLIEMMMLQVHKMRGRKEKKPPAVSLAIISVTIFYFPSSFGLVSLRSHDTRDQM